MPRVIYLIALERVFNNAIFENQVKKLLLRVKREHGESLELTLVVLLPWIELTRRGVYSNFRRYKNELDSLRQELARKGIRLITVRTLFSSAFFNMKALGLAWFSLSSLFSAWRVFRSRRVNIVHCRYYYATFLALLIRRLTGGRFKVIFDVRSLLPEQGVVNGNWRAGSFTFRFWKAVERWMFKSADLSVAVSPAMASRIKEENPQAPAETIPNFADLDTFKPDPVKRVQSRRELGIEKRRVLVFSGTVGKRYPAGRIAEAVQVFFRLFGTESFFLLLSPSDEKRLAPLADALASRGLKRGETWVCLKAPPEEVPFYLNAADWALLVLADFLSGETAVARDDYVFPIKFAEYLALGLPILTHPSNRGMRETVQSYGVGAVLDGSLPPEKLRAALEQNETQMRERCLETARNDFSLSRFAARYSEIYRELA
ncbi:MAG: glycosyltransferase [Deltaproteobacteria bacterium]|nr:glycosyltransferase [Deltaproteobacteria bacterium]